jgi:hypothetical protein
MYRLAVRQVGLLLDLLLDLTNYPLGLVVFAVGHQPAGALRDVAPHQQDCYADYSRPYPVGAVFSEVGPAAHPGWDQLVYGRVDSRVLSS